MTSVLDTQRRLLALEDTRRGFEEKLAKVKERIEKVKEAHREQIAKSLTSTDPEEREMAHGIATFWEVPFPQNQ